MVGGHFAVGEGVGRLGGRYWGTLWRMAVEPWPVQSEEPPGVAPGALRRWDVILALVFLVLFWGLGLGLGPRGLAVVGALLFCAISFLFPRGGLVLTLAGELTLTTLTFFTAVNRAPSMRGAEGTVGYELPFEFHAMAACVAFLATAWTGAGFALILSGERWTLGSLERSLVTVMALFAAWCTFSAANGVEFLPLLYDLHIVIWWGSAVLMARLLSGRRDWLWMIGLSALGGVLHGFILLIDLTGPGVFSNPEHLTDILRATIGGSPDMAGPFVPILLALDILVLEQGSRWRKSIWIAALVLTFRTFATLSRSAIAQLVVALMLLSAMLTPGVERSGLWRRVGSLLLVLGLCLGAASVVSPSIGKAALFVVTERVLDVTAGREKATLGEEEFGTGSFSGADGTSDVYRILETEVAVEQLSGDWLVGRGPGATINKRFRGSEVVSAEAYLHNGFLWYVLKVGLLGLAFVLWAYGLFFWVGIRALRVVGLEPWERALTIGYLASVAPLLVTAWTNNIIGAPTGMYFLVPGFAWMCYLERTRLMK